MFWQILGKTSHINFHKNLSCGSYPVTYLTNGQTWHDKDVSHFLQLLCGFIERLTSNLTLDQSMMQMCLFKSKYLIPGCREVRSSIGAVERTWLSTESNEWSWDLDGPIWPRKKIRQKMRYPALGNLGSSVWTRNLQRGTITFCFCTSWQECFEYDDFCEILVYFEAFSLTGCCAVLADSWLQMLQQCMAVPSSQLKMSTLYVFVCVCVCVHVCERARVRACTYTHTELCKLWQKGNRKCTQGKQDGISDNN